MGMISCLHFFFQKEMGSVDTKVTMESIYIISVLIFMTKYLLSSTLPLSKFGFQIAPFYFKILLITVQVMIKCTSGSEVNTL